MPSKNNNQWWVESVIVIACLLFAQLAWHQPLSVPLVCLSVMAFALSALILKLARTLDGGKQEPFSILVGW